MREANPEDFVPSFRLYSLLTLCIFSAFIFLLALILAFTNPPAYDAAYLRQAARAVVQQTEAPEGAQLKAQEDSAKRKKMLQQASLMLAQAIALTPYDAGLWREYAMLQSHLSGGHSHNAHQAKYAADYLKTISTPPEGVVMSEDPR